MGFLLQKTCFKGRFNHEESTVDDALYIWMIFIEFISCDKREKSTHFIALGEEKSTRKLERNISMGKRKVQDKKSIC